MDKFDAAGLIVKFKDLVLLGRRSKFCHDLNGYWSMACGAIESDEKPEETAIREFFEETNIKIDKEVSQLTSFNMKNGGTFYVYYTEIQDLLFPDSKAQDALEHDEWGYFKIEKNCLPTPITQETTKAILMAK